MLYSKIILKLHWGFSIVLPSASKSKPAVFLPPPTTLIGALSYGKYRGLDTMTISNRLGSPAYNLPKVRATARFSDDVAGGAYVEDIVRNVIMYFQRPTKERRLNPKYMHGIVPTGKVYVPNSDIMVVYITDSMTKEELEKLSWSITRLGCKECLVSVEDVEVGEAKRVSGRMRTKYYFPDIVRVLGGNFDYVDFWDEDGFIWGKEGKRTRYVLPITRYPLRSVEVTVEAKEAYEVGGEYVVFG